MSDPTDADLHPFGYAPGNYMGRCFRCGEQTNDVDKRASSCRPCAVLRWEKYRTDPDGSRDMEGM